MYIYDRNRSFINVVFSLYLRLHAACFLPLQRRVKKTVTWEPSSGPAVHGGVFRGTGMGLILIHPMLQSARSGTISPAWSPPHLFCDLWPHIYGCCPWPFHASILLLSAIFTPFDFPAGHSPDWVGNLSVLLPYFSNGVLTIANKKRIILLCIYEEVMRWKSKILR